MRPHNRASLLSPHLKPNGIEDDRLSYGYGTSRSHTRIIYKRARSIDELLRKRRSTCPPTWSNDFSTKDGIKAYFWERMRRRTTRAISNIMKSDVCGEAQQIISRFLVRSQTVLKSERGKPLRTPSAYSHIRTGHTDEPPRALP